MKTTPESRRLLRDCVGVFGQADGPGVVDLLDDFDELQRELDGARRGWALGLAQALHGEKPIHADEREDRSREAAAIIFGTREALRLFPTDEPWDRCPKCGKTGMVDPCCNTQCGGIWGSGCYHCHGEPIITKETP